MKFIYSFLYLCFALHSFGAIIQDTNKIEWRLAGYRDVRAWRSNVFDVTTFGADKTGVTNDAATNFMAAYETAKALGGNSNSIFVPAGRYRWGSSVFQLDAHNITLRGEGTNSIIMLNRTNGNAIYVGPSQGSRGVFWASNSLVQGTTNIVLNTNRNEFNELIAPGDQMVVSTLNYTNDSGAGFVTFSVHGFERLLHEVVKVHSVNGNTVSISRPLTGDYPWTPKVELLYPFKTNIGIENIVIVQSNNITGELGDVVAPIKIASVAQSWVSNVIVQPRGNYGVYFLQCHLMTAEKVDVYDKPAGGSNGAGIFWDQPTYCILQNCIIRNVFPPLEVQSSMGNVFAYIYTPSPIPNAISIQVHGTHPRKNLFEGIVGCTILFDGYFGSESEETLFRCYLSGQEEDFAKGSVWINRFVTGIQVVGCVFGHNRTNWVSHANGNPPSVASLIWLGYSGIGSPTYEYTAPPRSIYFPNEVYHGMTNGAFELTNDIVSVTNLLIPAHGRGTFTNIPPQNGSVIALKFQDPVNTNRYYNDPTNTTRPFSTVLWGTTSNLHLEYPISAPSGSVLYLVGVDAYQNRMLIHSNTHNFHGNLFYTNGIGQPGTLVWDENNADHVLTNSMYLSTAELTAIGTNRIPAIDPEAAQPVSPTFSVTRYNEMLAATSSDNSVTNSSIFSGNVNFGGTLILK